MKTERWGNGCAVEIQRLTASKLLPQLTQDAFLLGGRDADTPPETYAVSSNEPGGFQLGVECGWGGWITVELWSGQGLWILDFGRCLAQIQALNSPSRDSFERP